MIQEFNFNRVVVELIPKETRVIWTPDTDKKAKTLDAIVRKVGSQVTEIKPGDKVKIFNEGIALQMSKKEFRIINDTGVALKIN